MKQLSRDDWEYGVRLRFFEMEQLISLEDVYQAFKARMLREQEEAAELLVQEQRDAFALWNGGRK